jgi:hypothetical protein
MLNLSIRIKIATYPMIYVVIVKEEIQGLVRIAPIEKINGIC